MDQKETNKRSDNQKPTTAQSAKEKKEMKTVNETARKILDMTEKPNFEFVNPTDRAVVEAAAITPLKKMLTHMTTMQNGITDGKPVMEPVPTLSLMGQTVSVRETVDLGDNKTETKTKNFHLWTQNQWIAVLEKAPVAMVCLNKKEAIANGIITTKDYAWIYKPDVTKAQKPYRTVLANGSFKQQDGYFIPSIGAYNYRTAKLEIAPTEHIVVNYEELHHGWHRGQEAILMARGSKSGTVNKRVDMLQEKINMRTLIDELRKNNETERADNLEETYHEEFGK